MRLPKNPLKGITGFTLAELLIALVIIGEIATFTIPKILAGQANSRNNAITKETMATFSGAYQQLQLNSSGGISLSTTPGALTQYMNYVTFDTSSTIDLDPLDAPLYPGGTFACSTTYPCVDLHNSAKLLLINPTSFSSTNGVIDAILDPDRGLFLDPL